MMALGELDDPLGVDDPGQRPTSPGVSPPLKPLGLVLAAEHEMMLGYPPGDEEARTTPVEPAPETKPWAYRPEPSMGTTPGRPSIPQPPPRPHRGVVVPPPARRVVDEASSAQRPALPRPPLAPQTPPPRAVPAVPARLPVPRAPSVPPEPPFDGADGLESLDSLDSLDGLGSLDTLDGLGSLDTLHGLGLLDTLDSLRGVQLEAPPSSSTALRPPPSSHPQVSPTSRPPVTPGGTALAPASAGLRLRPRPLAEDEPTPVSEAPVSLADRLSEMAILFDARNYPGALVLAESVLSGSPDHVQARRCAETCREMLGQKYLSRLGGRENVPRVTMSAEEMRVLSLDHRAGFLLSFIDGSMSIDEVLDVSSMPELDALRMMFELRMQGVIEIVEPGRRRAPKPPGRR